jgi:type I restriction enzyme, S subunit
VKKGWEIKSVGDILKLEYGKPLAESERKLKGHYPVYGANGEKDRTDRFYYDKPSIIVGRKGSAGEINLTEKKFWPLDVTYFVTFDDSKYDLRFLYYLLKTLELTKLAKGVKPGINRKEVYSQNTKIPPLGEQKRIVGILDEAFAGIAIAKANAEKNLQNARALFESHLQSVFTKHRKECVERKLGDETLLEMIDGDRGTNYPQSSDFHKEGHCLFMNTKNVRPNGFDFETTMFITKEKDSQLRKGKLKRHDIVMTTRGTIGNIGLYSDDIVFKDIRINSGMLIFRVNQKQILPAFLFELFRSQIVKTQIKKHTSGAAQPQLPIKTLVNFTIPVPISLKMQQSIVGTINKFSNETNRLAAIYERKQAALSELRQSLLHRAFAGAL